jgi:hypothetical protein
MTVAVAVTGVPKVEMLVDSPKVVVELLRLPEFTVIKYGPNEPLEAA